MEKMNNPFEIRRILAALDASPRSLAGIETVVDLAANFGAELIGLFVEDINLLRAAGLPFVREISRFSSAGRRIEQELLHREMRSQAARIRESLARAADARGVPWAFRVVRGSVPAEILSAALDADLMILGKMTWSPGGGGRLGSTVRTVLLQGRGLTLILHEQTRFTAPVLVIYDGSDLSKKALEVSLRLARTGDDGLKVFVIASDRDKALERREEVVEALHSKKSDTEFQLLFSRSLSGLTRLVQSQGNGPLVLPLGLCQGEDLCTLVSVVPNPVFLVR